MCLNHRHKKRSSFLTIEIPKVFRIKIATQEGGREGMSLSSVFGVRTAGVRAGVPRGLSVDCEFDCGSQVLWLAPFSRHFCSPVCCLFVAKDVFRCLLCRVRFASSWYSLCVDGWETRRSRMPCYSSLVPTDSLCHASFLPRLQPP